MSKFIKVLSNELIKIEEYKNPKICFNDTTYDDIENYCVLRETINPFQMFYENKDLQQENQSLKDRIENGIEYIKERTEFNQYSEVYPSVLDAREVKRLLEILKGDK